VSEPVPGVKNPSLELDSLGTVSAAAEATLVVLDALLLFVGAKAVLEVIPF